MNAKKVYCDACRYYARPCQGEFSFTPDECWYSDNIHIEKSEVKADYRHASYEVIKKSLIKKPEDINKHNDCKWFKKRKAGRKG